MGIMRTSQIDAFAANTGIKAACGNRSKILSNLSNRAFELIKIIELEHSGIRDGDGYWSGTDPLGGVINDLAEGFQRLEKIEKDETLRDEVATFAAYCIGSTAPQGDWDSSVDDEREKVMTDDDTFDHWLKQYRSYHDCQVPAFVGSERF